MYDHPVVRKIHATEKDVNTQLYIFHHKIVETLFNIEPVKATDDFLMKQKEVGWVLHIIIEKKT